jgi:hypothetical protein
MADDADVQWFRSKVDWWIAILLCVPPIAVVAVNVALFAGEKSGEWPVGVMTALVVLGVYFGFVFPMRYGLGNGLLIVRSGLLRQTITLQDVVEVSRTHNPLSSPALSLDRLRVQFGAGFFKAVMISPADRERFLQVMAHMAGLRRDGDHLFRT